MAAVIAVLAAAALAAAQPTPAPVPCGSPETEAECRAAVAAVRKPRWKGLRQHRGKGLAAVLKAIGFIIPLMDAEYANYYTREVMIILLREFASPDEEMKKIEIPSTPTL